MPWPADPLYGQVLAAGLLFAAVTALASTFVLAPYGRFASTTFGPGLPIRWGWILMEAPALPVYAWTFAQAGPRDSWVPALFLALWTMHYLNRGLIFPLRSRPRPGATMGVVVVLSGMAVVGTHAWLYAAWVGQPGGPLDTPAWLEDPRLWLGLALYLTGFGLLTHSEATLAALRSGDDRGYHIPRGGGFHWVSSPHYLGELLAWTGLALATWCPGGLFVLAVSAANLVPRAAAVQRWYHERFPDYPAERRALIPFLW
jgi:3-oxo-5-alpha-steroid 4-dehydrogenase 1